jgi:hypothetical protein
MMPTLILNPSGKNEEDYMIEKDDAFYRP